MNAPVEALFPTLGLNELQRAVPDLDRIAYSEIVKRRLLIATIDCQTVLLASSQAQMQALDWLQNLGDEHPMRVGLCSEADFDAIVQKTGASLKALPTQSLENVSADENEPIENLSLASLAEEKNPTVKLLGSTLFDASRSRASDIHIETHSGGASIKYRLDGMLVQALDISGREKVEQLISRLKVLSALDVGERRLPQDGRMRVALDAHRFELRVSILPGIFGESAVLRLLDRSGLVQGDEALSLEHLGLGKQSIQKIRELSLRPHGMLLITGPTGSGKTTTLYGAVAEINNSLQKIITVEDPVEYQLAGVLQVAVNEKTGMTFSKGLRAILRHDPDTILVGEIRDAETAQIAVQASMTGHLVFSSVHANSSVDVIGRLTHMGVDTYNLASALNGVVSQRLLRKVCLRCKQSRLITLAEKQKWPALQSIGNSAYGKGCGECRGTGYKGRIACAEVLEFDDELRECIINRVSPRLLLVKATEKGMIGIGTQALELLKQEIISLAEYERVAAPN
jgi:general secretion pathway protein E